MKGREAIKKTDRLGILACIVFAVACLSAAIYQTTLLLPLIENGRRTEALVVGIDVGAKGSKRAVFQFIAESGSHVTARDLFDMYVIRLHKGETVTVVYDPSNPKTVTADLGPWTWQGPAIFFFGFVFMAALGILLHRHQFRDGKQ